MFASLTDAFGLRLAYHCLIYAREIEGERVDSFSLSEFTAWQNKKRILSFVFCNYPLQDSITFFLLFLLIKLFFLKEKFGYTRELSGRFATKQLDLPIYMY